LLKNIPVTDINISSTTKCGWLKDLMMLCITRVREMVYYITRVREMAQKLINFRINYSFDLFICHEILVWFSSFSLSQFGPHFLKNDSIWSSPLTLTKRWSKSTLHVNFWFFWILLIFYMCHFIVVSRVKVT